MFKKNLYSFCALIALSCNAYAMEDDSIEEKSGRSALRASSASWGIDDQESAETEASLSSPASSFFPDSDKKVTFTWPALQQAASYENPNPDPRAKALHGFFQEMYYSNQVVWDPEVIYELPLLQSQLDGNIWDLAQDRELVRKIGKAIKAYPTTQKAIIQLSEALGWAPQDFSDSKERRRKLKELTLRAVNELKTSREKLSSTEAEYTSFREIRLQELANKEEAERQLTAKLVEQGDELESSKTQILVKEKEAEELTAKLVAQGDELEKSKAQILAKEKEAEELTSRLAVLEAELKKFKEDTESLVGGLKASLAEKDAQNQLLQSVVSEIQATLTAAAERLASLPTQASE